MDTENTRVKITDVYMPWNRMFEVGVTVKAVED
ncbi:MAG: hypothetical protein ACQEXX_26085 [Bacillota bacterium]